MTYYTVVTRDKRKLPIDYFMSIEAAANYIVREQKFHVWTVLAQDGGKAAPFRELNRNEGKRLDKALYPSLHD